MRALERTVVKSKRGKLEGQEEPFFATGCLNVSSFYGKERLRLNSLWKHGSNSEAENLRNARGIIPWAPVLNLERKNLNSFEKLKHYY